MLQEQEEATKARRYRFLKQSEERKAYPLPGTKENQVDEGRNHYPTSFKLLSLAPPFQKPRKSTPWDLTFSPRSLRDQAKSSQTHPPLPFVLRWTQWGFLLSLLTSHSPLHVYGGECSPTTLVAVTTSYFSSRNFRQSLVRTLL